MMIELVYYECWENVQIHINQWSNLAWKKLCTFDEVHLDELVLEEYIVHFPYLI